MTDDPETDDIYQDGRIASFDNAIKCEICERWSNSPTQFDIHTKSKAHKRAVMNLRWKKLIKKLRVETKAQNLFEHVTGSMTECLIIDPWRRIIKKLLRERVLRESCEVLRDLFKLVETNRLLLEEGRRQSLAQHESRMRDQGRAFQQMWCNLPPWSSRGQRRWRAQRRVTFQEGGSTSSGARSYR